MMKLVVIPNQDSIQNTDSCYCIEFSQWTIGFYNTPCAQSTYELTLISIGATIIPQLEY